MIVKQLVRTRPSFLTGMARTLDLGGTLDDYDLDLEECPEIPSDAESLARDRESLREDLFRAFTTLRQRIRGQGDGCVEGA
jgi:hypothetical protein